MRTVERTAPHNLGKLHDELLEAIPELRGTPGPDGRLEAMMSIGALGDVITLEVPDKVSDEQIDAVLADHDPTPRPARLSPRAVAAEVLLTAAKTDPVAAAIATLLRVTGQEPAH
jgi:hypothetical protein